MGRAGYVSQKYKSPATDTAHLGAGNICTAKSSLFAIFREEPISRTILKWSERRFISNVEGLSTHARS